MKSSVDNTRFYDEGALEYIVALELNPLFGYEVSTKKPYSRGGVRDTTRDIYRLIRSELRDRERTAYARLIGNCCWRRAEFLEGTVSHATSCPGCPPAKWELEEGQRLMSKFPQYGDFQERWTDKFPGPETEV